MHPEELSKYKDRSVASLGRVILEGVSIAYEYELFKAIQNETHENQLLVRFQEFARRRVKSVRQTNIYLSTEYRRNNGWTNSNEFDPSAYPPFVYSEGVKLAIALKRNGRSLKDLPDLFERMKQVVEAEAGASDGERFLQIGVSTDYASMYQRIVRKVRQLSVRVPFYWTRFKVK